ncbi:MAG TPA: zinc-dependent metalloprotease [Flavobacteriales bacterium]
MLRTLLFVLAFPVRALLPAQTLIPVVVHVIHQGGPENISDAQVHSQIAVLNADYRRLNADTVNTRPIFQAVAADLGIEFCLAALDPAGQPTTGIDRVETDETSPTALIAAHGWDVERYLNLYVMPSGSCFASFPWEPDEQQGVFITHGRFGTVGTVGTEEFAEWARFGRTATHEVGHYLGLMHTFSFIGDVDLCLGGDSVCDTPPTDMRWMVSTCLDHGLNTNLEEPDLPDQVENFMDYNIDSCTNLFTEGQRQRVMEKIAAFRSVLVSEENGQRTGCRNSTGIGEPLPASPVLSPNPAGDFVQLSVPVPVHVELFDRMGVRQRVWLALPQERIDLQGLAPGVYLLRVMAPGLRHTERLVVMR